MALRLLDWGQEPGITGDFTWAASQSKVKELVKMSTAYVDDRQLQDLAAGGADPRKKREVIWDRIEYLCAWDPWLENEAKLIRGKMARNRAWSFAIGWTAVGLASVASVTTFTSLLQPWVVGTISALAALVVATGKFLDANGKNADLAKLETLVEGNRYKVDTNEMEALHGYDYIVSKWPESAHKTEDDLIKFVETKIDYINSWYHREYAPNSARYNHLGKDHPADPMVPSGSEENQKGFQPR